MLGLPASERRILGKIEQAIQGSDPQLMSLFTIFSRLNRDEHMPVRLRPRRPTRLVAWLLVPVAATVLVVTIALTANSGGCTGAAPPSAARHHAQLKTCVPAGRPLLLGGR